MTTIRRTLIRIGLAPSMVLVGALTIAAATSAADRFTFAPPPAPESRTN
jgi:hypothetical protein